jgi:two-component system, cell cycle sensor histidine kinase and response regulator CckA
MGNDGMTPPLRVLHLEDNPRDAEVVRDRLDAEGFSCDILVVNDKASFEAEMLREPRDLIISDYNLPGYDGVSALKRAQVAWPDVPVILISGTVGEEEAVNCLHIGATDYLLKDRLDRLVPAVQRAIHEAAARRTRKRAEAALSQSETRKAAILDSVLDCIFTIGANGMVIELNAAAERTFGYTKAEAVGRMLADLIVPPRFRDAHRAGLARYLATGESRLLGTIIEITALRSDGSEIPVELAITAVLSDDGPIFIGVLRDITARRHADETRARLAAIVESSDDAIFSMGLDDTILTWNAGAERLYGYTAGEVIGQHRMLLAPAGTSGDLSAILDAAARGEKGQPFETQRIRKDGSLIDISLTISPTTEPDGRVTSVSAIARDITNRKRAEAELQRLNDENQSQRRREVEVAQKRLEDLEHQVTERQEAVEAMRTAEERTQFVLQNANVGVWDMDYATNVLKWSGTMEAQYGLRPGTFGGSFDAFIELIHPDDRASALDSISQAMTSGADYTLLHRTIWPDGTTHWLSGAGRLILGERGEPVRAVGTCLDVTERRALEAQYQQAQKMEAIGQLAGGVAHDFNNLLTVILGYCEMLRDGLDADDQCQLDLAQIQKAGESAAGLTRQLLAFSRKEIIEPTLLDLNVVLANMRAMLNRLIREDVKIVLSLRPEPAAVKADSGQIEQIVLNLAVNARDAMPQGGTLTIEIANVELDDAYAKVHLGVTPGSYVRLAVTDTGSGMTPEVKAHLFEPFFTTKELGVGTGLGLATVHGIVKQNDGSITVTSEIGKGTSFHVYFPQADASEMVVVAPPPVARARAGGETVVVVEDAEGLRLLVTKLLERLGYTVLIAANADHAVQLFEDHPSIDVLLTDVVMPGTSGPELTRRLVARWPELKVIYMSGYTDEAIVHHGVLDPGIAFLHKPFTAETLGRKIREVLDR